jgi:hypothetical protein
MIDRADSAVTERKRQLTCGPAVIESQGRTARTGSAVRGRDHHVGPGGKRINFQICLPLFNKQRNKLYAMKKSLQTS